MSEIFIIGRVSSEVKYKFIINSKRYFSKVKFEIEISKQKFKVIGYNNIVDYCYRKLKKEDKIFLYFCFTSLTHIQINRRKW